jgi:hypothetical protein
VLTRLHRHRKVAKSTPRQVYSLVLLKNVGIISSPERHCPPLRYPLTIVTLNIYLRLISLVVSAGCKAIKMTQERSSLEHVNTLTCVTALTLRSDVTASCQSSWLWGCVFESWTRATWPIDPHIKNVHLSIPRRMFGLKYHVNWKLSQ